MLDKTYAYNYSCTAHALLKHHSPTIHNIWVKWHLITLFLVHPCSSSVSLPLCNRRWRQATSAAAPLNHSSNIDLCAEFKHSCKKLAMTLWSCKVKKEDKIGAGPQKMVVKLSLIEQYAALSNTNWCSCSAVSEALRQKCKHRQDRSVAPYLLSVRLINYKFNYFH